MAILQSQAGQTRTRVVDFIQSKYGETTNKLMREFRIFTGTSAVLFLLFATAPLIKPAATLQLLPVAVALLTTFVLCSWLYIFNQRWLHTVLFGDYLGWAYLAWVTTSLLLFADLLLNRARVTVRLLSTISSGASLSPC